MLTAAAPTPDGEGVAGAPHDPRVEVTTGLIRAERVSPARRLEGGAVVDGSRQVSGEELRGEDRDEEQHGEGDREGEAPRGAGEARRGRPCDTLLRG
jgi:hypothetical protein